MPFSWPVYRHTDLERRRTLVTGPTAEPLTLIETKLHLKIETTITTDDALIGALITAARHQVERMTERQLITATWQLKLDRFPCYKEPITLPMPPLLSIVSVKYQDTNDVQQTWGASNYVVDAPKGPYAPEGRVYLAFNVEYPDTASRPDAVVVEFTAGYGPTDASVPQPLKQAMLLLIGHWYENRETVNIGNITTELPFAAEALLGPFQRWTATVR